MRLGPWEIALIVVVVLLIFGPKQLPRLARSLGKAMREFRRGVREVSDELERASREDVEEDDEERLEG